MLQENKAARNVEDHKFLEEDEEDKFRVSDDPKHPNTLLW